MVTVEQLRPSTPTDAAVWDIAATVCDPEIPVLTIEDLGILRAAHVAETGRVEVTITPTYSGCPAMDAIRDDVTIALGGAGYDDVAVRLVLAPAWTTDWMSDDGKAKLEEYGIAPPTGTAAAGPVRVGLSVKCPQCSSLNTRELTRFGSTSCKALYVCSDCKEPFDYFKVH
ncbi:phenylacetate-CoA oxygenase subunit PaaJ [Arthrobacter echini]|uniref:Phenylacetate-CoA oxygenase subunit PaaJ n=1 Tax=Arthrobacter echini TaxID=1529066 RepID=A0A5D0XUI1_9MICC|nr:1,2-phenylacetyl-CoA epoxidase subunit PaaD [Arthrobacter echini]TYD00180.1 phenylacetate-CoA oxygenase subunit PaaJ [Arthrobacter echini]